MTRATTPDPRPNNLMKTLAAQKAREPVSAGGRYNCRYMSTNMPSRATKSLQAMQRSMRACLLALRPTTAPPEAERPSRDKINSAAALPTCQRSTKTRVNFNHPNEKMYIKTIRLNIHMLLHACNLCFCKYVKKK